MFLLSYCYLNHLSMGASSIKILFILKNVSLEKEINCKKRKSSLKNKRNKNLKFRTGIDILDFGMGQELSRTLHHLGYQDPGQ